MRRALTKTLAILLFIVTLFGIIPHSASAASATVDWPDISRNAYAEYVCPVNIPVFRNQNLTQRGNSNGAYNSHTDPGDLLFIYSISDFSTMISMPTSKGRVTGWVETASLLGVKSPRGIYRAETKVSTFREASLRDRSGSVYKAEYIHLLGQTKTSILFIYPAVQGQRAYKMGWVSKETFASYFSKVKMSTANQPAVAYFTPSHGNWTWDPFVEVDSSNRLFTKFTVNETQFQVRQNGILWHPSANQTFVSRAIYISPETAHELIKQREDILVEIVEAAAGEVTEEVAVFIVSGLLGIAIPWGGVAYAVLEVLISSQSTLWDRFVATTESGKGVLITYNSTIGERTEYTSKNGSVINGSTKHIIETIDINFTAVSSFAEAQKSITANGSWEFK